MKPGDVFSSGNSLYLRINRRKSVNLLSPHEDLVDLDPSTYDKDEWKVEFNLYEMMRDIHNNPPKEDKITITVNKETAIAVEQLLGAQTSLMKEKLGLTKKQDQLTYDVFSEIHNLIHGDH